MNYIAWIWHNRSNFVFVPQGNTLMSGTIRYNMQLAKPDEIIVRLTGLEPAHRKIPDPKSGASTNSATSAWTH